MSRLTTRVYRVTPAAPELFTALDGAAPDFPLPGSLRIDSFGDPRAWPYHPLWLTPQVTEADVRALAALDDGAGAFPPRPWLTEHLVTKAVGPCFGVLARGWALLFALDGDTLTAGAVPYTEDGPNGEDTLWRAVAPFLDAAGATATNNRRA